MKNEVTSLKKKYKELERMIDEQLFTLIRDLKGQINNVDDQLLKKNIPEQLETPNSKLYNCDHEDFYEEELKRKDIQIEKLKKEKQSLKDENTKKLENEYKKYKTLKEFSELEISNLKKEKDEQSKVKISSKNMDEQIKVKNTKKLKRL